MSKWNQRRGGQPRGPRRPGQPPLGQQPSAVGARGAGLARLPLPHEVAEIVRARKNDPIHPGFWITRFVRWAEHPDNPNRWDFKLPRPGGRGEGDRKRDNLDQAVETVKGAGIVTLAREWLNRRRAWLEPLEKEGLARSFRARTEWRLTIGLAGASPLETSIRLHHLYGVPILPGSGLKGLALAAARRDPSAKKEDCEKVLGTQQRAGLVDFLDAIAVPSNGLALLEVDVMNPHYPDWYRSKAALPSDDQNPTPVFFLTVPPRTQFDFALLCRTRTDHARSALHQAEKWLRDGLYNLGAGAKTSSGYGYFASDI